MNKNFLKKLIIELKEEIETDDQLTETIELFGILQEKINEEQAKIQNIVDEISKMEKENKNRFKDVKKYMERFNIDKKKASNWVAKLEEKLKFTRPRPDYKDLWLETMEKVNEATQRVMKKMEENQIELKKTQKELVLNIQKEGITDFFKKVFIKLKGLFSSFSYFNKIIKGLPKI